MAHRKDLLQAQHDLDMRFASWSRLTFYIAAAEGLDLPLADIQTTLDDHNDYVRAAAEAYKVRINILTNGTIAPNLPSSESESILSIRLDNGRYSFICHQVSRDERLMGCPGAYSSTRQAVTTGKKTAGMETQLSPRR